MQGVSAVVTVGIAVIAAAAGAFAAVEQLLLPARLRRQSEWATSTAEAEEDEVRKAVLHRLAAKCTGRLVAASAVPAYVFLELLVTTAGSVWLLVLFARDAKTWTDYVAPVITAFAAESLSSRRAIRLYLERVRIADAYIDSCARIPAADLGILAQMEGGQRVEFVWAASAGVGLTSAGLTIALGAHGHDSAVFPGVIAAFALILVFGWLRSRPKARDL